jgi:hypothetical protein
METGSVTAVGISLVIFSHGFAIFAPIKNTVSQRYGQDGIIGEATTRREQREIFGLDTVPFIGSADYITGDSTQHKNSLSKISNT